MGNGQANQAFGNANSAAATAGNLSAQNNANSQGLFNSLWGGTGSGGAGSGGALGSFLNPANLNQATLNPQYAAQYTASKNQNAQSNDQAKQGLGQQAQASGFGAGSNAGWNVNAKNQADLNLGNANQQSYQTALGTQNAEALNNFWNTANMANGTSNSAANNAIGANQGASSTYSQLYGSAPKTTPMSVLQPLLGAGGTVGAAALCVCEFTPIRMADGTQENVERLRIGDAVKGLGGPNAIVGIERQEGVPCYALKTESGLFLMASESHTLALHGGGYVLVKDSSHAIVLTERGWEKVVHLEKTEPMLVFKLRLNGSHTYISGGVYSLE